MEPDGKAEFQLMGRHPVGDDRGLIHGKTGWLQTFTWTSLLEIEMETFRSTGFLCCVYELGIAVQLSWNHIFPFRANRGNRCLPRSVLGASE